MSVTELSKKRSGSEPDTPGDVKKHKVDSNAAEDGGADGVNIASIEQAIAPLMEKLKSVEKRCVAEQMAVQRKYECEREPLYKERDALIGGHWGELVCMSKFCRMLLNPNEANLLIEHLKTVKLHDNLDDNSSYEVIFEFKETASGIFTPLTLRKKVIFNDDMDVDEEKTEITTITFTDEKQDPRELIKKYVDEEENKKQEETDDEESMALGSIFEWFSKKSGCTLNIMDQFGETFRREIYPNPFEDLNAFSDSEGEEEEEDDEKNQKQ